MVGLRRDRLGCLGIPHDDVGIGTDRDRALAREDVENLRGIRRRYRDELVHRQPAGVNAVRPQYLHAVLDAGGAVRNAAEVVATGRFLVGTKTAVIGRRRLQVAGLQAAPQQLLVLLRTERRAHDVRRGELEIRVAVDRIVDQQVPGEHFAVHPLTLIAGARDRLQRLPAGGVHEIDRHAQDLGDANRAVGRFAFHFRRTRQRVAFRTANAHVVNLLLQAINEFTVFRMAR